MKNEKSILLIISAIIIIGCNQPASIQNESEGLSDEQTELRSKLKQTAKILTELVTDQKVVKELKLATHFALQKGRDEDVTFSELFYDNAEYKIGLKAKNSSSIGVFRDRFREYIDLKAKSSNNIDSDLEAYLVANNLKIYFPYSENWEDEEVINPTISFDPIDNEDENEGYINSNSHSKTVNSVNTVLVNDAYVYENPSFLILSCDDAPILKIQTNNAISCGGGGIPNPPPSPPDNGGGTGEDYDKIVLGQVQLRGQFDGLFGGGSEIRMDITNAYFLTSYAANPTVETFRILERTFTRKDARKKRWKNVYIVVDDDWAEYELAKELYIWEGDGGGTTQIDLTSRVEVNSSTQINVTSSVTVDNDRDFIFKGILDRGVFLSENKQPHPVYGKQNGYRVRVGNDKFHYYFENYTGTRSDD